VIWDSQSHQKLPAIEDNNSRIDAFSSSISVIPAIVRNADTKNRLEIEVPEKCSVSGRGGTNAWCFVVENHGAVCLQARITLKHSSRCIEDIHIQLFHDTENHAETFHKAIHRHPEHSVRCGLVLRSEDGLVMVLSNIGMRRLNGRLISIRCCSSRILRG
jgi:hypothetical protein